MADFAPAAFSGIVHQYVSGQEFVADCKHFYSSFLRSVSLTPDLTYTEVGTRMNGRTTGAAHHLVAESD